MKLSSYCLILILFLFSCVPSQSYFKTPNNVHNIKVVLHLLNKPDMAGIITVPWENNFDKDQHYTDAVKFLPEGENVEVNLNIKDVLGYTLGKDYYALKKIDLFINDQYHLLFVKRLTSENSRIQLYELYETGLGNDMSEIRYSYFISLPKFGQFETLNTSSKRLIPDFDLKMSALVSDCPALAEKIRNRENGYFVPF